MIKIYTYTSFITPQYRKMVFPLLFDLCYLQNEELLKLYQVINSIENSDVVVVPVDIDYFFRSNKRKWLDTFLFEAIQLNKKVWIYSAGDFGITINTKVYTFRLGGFASKLKENTFILPSFIMDPYSILKKEFKTVSKPSVPKIGFVGHADGSLFKWVTEFLIYFSQNSKRIANLIHHDYQAFYPSSNKRYQILRALQKNNQIETDFVFRKKYRAGVKTDEEKLKTTIEFFENIYNNPYVFCLRGAGNFSVRFYEALAMGRIPVLINTDIRLPLEEIINWKNHCIMTNEKDIADKLIDFHRCINADDFEQMQINNRSLWLNYLNRDTYFSHIYSIFKENKI